LEINLFSYENEKGSGHREQPVTVFKISNSISLYTTIYPKRYILSSTGMLNSIASGRTKEKPSQDKVLL